MDKSKRLQLFDRIVLIFEVGVLVIFLYWHLQLGLVRYFDSDEFAHLHWGYSFAAGELPYKDFFYLFPPFFLYPLAAIFKIFGRTIDALLAGRMFIFLVFLATSGVLFLIAKKLRGASFALLTLIFFAFLPLPFDKMIEVRPDIAATFLALSGLYIFIQALEKNKSRLYFASGFFYALSLGFIPKTIFFLFPPILAVSFLGYLSHLSRGRKENKSLAFFLGILAVILLLFLILIPFADLRFSLYSMTKMASDVTKTLGAKFYMRPDIFFYPNDTFYGFSDLSPALIINLLIYITASIWAIHKLINIGSSTVGGVKASTSFQPATSPSVSLAEFLVVATFWANLAAFVLFYPLKHSQYLIPLAPFIAYYFADALSVILRYKPKDLVPIKSGRFARFFAPLRMTILIVFLLFIAIIGTQMNQKKMQWTNKATFERIKNILNTVLKDEPIFDLTGETIFYKNGYYFCCLPYGQYIEAIGFKVPDLEKELQKRGSKYVHAGWEKRLSEIPAQHAKYIQDNFTPMSSNQTLWVRKP